MLRILSIPQADDIDDMHGNVLPITGTAHKIAYLHAPDGFAGHYGIALCYLVKDLYGDVFNCLAHDVHDKIAHAFTPAGLTNTGGCVIDEILRYDLLESLQVALFYKFFVEAAHDGLVFFQLHN